MGIVDDEADLDPDHDDEHGNGRPQPPLTGANYYKFAQLLAREVKVKLGCAKPTQANRLVAHELVNKAMEARDVRKCDRHKFLPLAVDMVFIPDKWAVAAAEFRKSAAVADRLLEMQDTLPVPLSLRLWRWFFK
jgi:hypothetical protein